MKKQWILFGTLILCATLLASCGTTYRTYRYIQVCTAKSIPNATTAQSTDKGLLYENEDCIVLYNLWGKGGEAGFIFYNKTNKVIHIDLSQTFFLRNGIAYNYYTPQTITQTTSSSVGVATTTSYAESYSAAKSVSAGTGSSTSIKHGNRSTGTSAATSASASWGAAVLGNASVSDMASFSKSTSVATTEEPVLSIPPQASKVISHYDIAEELFVDCDLNKYPSDSAHISFSEEDSPLTFANYISYRVGDNKDVNVIENQFYIADIYNYAEPYALVYVEREKTCDNVLTPDEQQQQRYIKPIYDAYVNISGDNSFYFTYSVPYSRIQLYQQYPQGAKRYHWMPQYNGYMSY